jgi:GH25 family lysozyme M1 (1,4-beta-N-acetylmuramidase)
LSRPLAFNNRPISKVLHFVLYISTMKKLLPLIVALALSLEALAQTILGVDVSHYQGTINWAQVQSPGNKVFAFAKATEGTTITDADFVTNVTGGTNAGVVMGAYHFAHPETNTATSEANYFLSIASPYIKAGYLPPVLDLEDPPSGPSLSADFTSAQLTTWVQTWMTTVQNATGIKPILYTDGTYANYLNSSLNTYGLWTADPDGSTGAPNPLATYLGNWTTYLFKQYSWTGTVSGISGTGDEDLDVFNGTLAQFNALIGANSVTPVFTANAKIGCPGMSVSFTDQSTSTGTITGYKWTFTGGTPDSSSAKNPVITYNTAGIYAVKEVVTSTTGIDSVVETAYITVVPDSTLPLIQTFQSTTFPPVGWTMNFPVAGDSAWALCSYTGYNSSRCMYFPANCGYTISTAGQRQELYTPAYSFANTSNPKMWFDVAYEPYNRTYSDTLAIYYSLDCGNSWTLVYLKGGMTLCTTGSTDSAGVDTSGGRGCFIPPNAQAWRTDTINLNQLVGDASVMFSIESRSGWGNIIYLDNINIASTGVTCTTPVTPVILASPATTNCGPIQLTAASSGCTGCIYSWSNNTTAASITATATGTYSVTATNGSCVSSPTSVSVTVNQPPNIAVSASPASACIGQTVSLSATGSANSYQWSGTGLQNMSGANVSAVASVAGNQIYTVTAVLNSCSATAGVTVNYTTTVEPAISISQTTANPICVGSQVTFSANATNQGSSPVYQWVSGSQNGSGNNFTLNNAVNGATVKCLLISNANCASPDSVYSNILTVNAQSVQPVTLSIATPDTNVCSGENITFTASPGNAGASPLYSWYLNGSEVSNSSGYTINNIQSSSAVFCILTSSANCVSGSPVTSNTINIHIQTSAQASVNISANMDTICAGTPVTFTAIPGNGGSSPVYSWQLNGVTVGSSNSSYTNNSLNNADAVSCSMVSSAGCVTNPDVTSNTVVMRVNPKPVADAGPSTTIIGTASATLGGHPTGAGGTSPYSYVWSPPAGLNSDTAANPVVSGIALNTIYTVTVTDSKGCSTTDSVEIYIGNCNIPAPTLQLNQCDFIAQNIASVNYQWYLQGNLIAGATSRFYQVVQSGSYYVQITDSLGCNAHSLSVYVSYPGCSATAIETVSDIPDFDIYPNPAGNVITVSIKNFILGPILIEILNGQGQIISLKNIYENGAGLKFNFNTSNFAEGTYLLRIIDENGNSGIQRFIKM